MSAWVAAIGSFLAILLIVAKRWRPATPQEELLRAIKEKQKEFAELMADKDMDEVGAFTSELLGDLDVLLSQHKISQGK